MVLSSVSEGLCGAVAAWELEHKALEKVMGSMKSGPHLRFPGRNKWCLVTFAAKDAGILCRASFLRIQ
jgi:hypothetical protein